MGETFLGYERPDGQVGVRNWVGVMSVADNINPVTRAIARTVQGTVPITTLFVRGLYGDDLEISYATLGGMGRNPNLGAVLVVGLEETAAGIVADRIRNVGKPVEVVCVQSAGGSIAAIADGTRKALDLAIEASKARRRDVPASMLALGVECGASDTTSGLASNPCLGRAADRLVDAGGRVVISETSEFLGAEHLFAERAVDEAVRRRFLERVEALEAQALARGADIRGSNPVPDNIRGGLTTIEEKAFGAMAKAGTRPLVGVLDYAEAPTRPGLHFMATPAAAVESMTGLAAGGCQLIAFTTGVCNSIGNMIAPTVKITGNVQTAERLADDVDVDVSAILEEGRGVEEMGDALYDRLLDVAAGTVTRSEALDQRETAISRFEPAL